MPQTLRIMIVAGEASGDAHAAKLVRALRDAAPEVRFEFFGAAGPRMRDEGVDAVVRADDLSIVGLIEIAAALPLFLGAYRDLKRAAAQRRPDVVVLVDFPDFNLKLARSLKKRGLMVVYYISPQLWAWRKHRVRIVKKYVDLMLTILPFEKEWYAKHDVKNVEYVGSPLAREVHPSMSKKEFCNAHGLDMSRPIVAMLPGSRGKEIARIMPVMLRCAAHVAANRPDVQFLIALASRKDLAKVRSLINGSGKDESLPEVLPVVVQQTYDALSSADAAAVTSGTATLEAGLLGTPMAVVYKTSALNYHVLEPMINVEHYGLINLIAGKRVAKELIQEDFTAEALSAELLRLLTPKVNSSARRELQGAADRLGHGGASKRAADAIFALLEHKRHSRPPNPE